MATLICFGFGYSAQHYVAARGARFDRIVVTVRDPERAASLNAAGPVSTTALVFDGERASADLDAAIAEADVVLVSVPPGADGDPVLAVYGEALARAAHVQSIVYLSTVGVYGDHHGAWVDEASECHPGDGRNRRRLTAERAWQNLGVRSGAAVALLRIAGIYGPGRNALENIRHGSAKRILKPGQVFNRIHVADIAQSIDAAVARHADGIYNLADDEPTPPGDPIVFAAKLLGVQPPPEIPFAEARQTMTEMAASFYADVKRVRNAKLKSDLGVVLRYPSCREGLSALWSERHT
jgi:nucleoside-diphosphate-sugar epimerase